MLYILAASIIGLGTERRPSVIFVYKIGRAIRKQIKEDNPCEPNIRKAIRIKAATGVDLINVKSGDRRLYISGILTERYERTSASSNDAKKPNKI